MNRTPTGLSELRRARDRGVGLLVAVFLFSVFVNVLMLTGPLFMLQVYDRVLGSRSEETLVALFVLVAALYVLMGLLDYARGRVLARFGARFQAALDDRVFQATLTRSLDPRQRATSASGLRDIEAIRTMFTSPAMLALFDIPWTPLFVAAIFIFHPLLGWMAIGGGALLIVITLANNWLTQRKSQRAQKAAAEAQLFAEATRSAAELIRAQGMRGAVEARWADLRDTALSQTVRVSDWTGLFSAFSKSFRLFLQSAMLGAGAWLVLQGEMTAGAMIAGSILLGRALAPIEQTIGQWPVVQRALNGWKTLAQLLTETPEESEAIALPAPKANLMARGVTVFAPGTRRPTLTGITLSVSPGEVLGVIGKSGAGKSTLAKTLLGLIPPASGDVRLDGATLAQYDPDQLGGYLGYLPQQVTLFTGTVAENIARMLPEPDEEKVIAAAKQANAHEMILRLPDGYKTVIHGQDNQLSGGQRQRIALARAFYTEPVVLILDEPNSALDSEGSAALNRAIRDVKSDGRAVILMSHRPGAISECDRLVVLEEGRIAADGPRDDVISTMLENAGEVQRTLAHPGPVSGATR